MGSVVLNSFCNNYVMNIIKRMCCITFKQGEGEHG